MFDEPSEPIHAFSTDSDAPALSDAPEEDPEPVSLDEIFSTEGDEDEIFTYVYNYNTD